jgi:riboflavin synthase
MFTGLVETIGHIAGVEERAGARAIAVACPTIAGELALGESVALDGCCVTVAERLADGFRVDLMTETLAVTTLGGLVAGDAVNLERAMRADARFGGHLVQGHVDGVAEVVRVEELPGTRLLHVELPSGLERYTVVKGSLCVAGVSLTLAGVEGRRVRIGLIPHTLAGTTLATLGPGSRVNVEVDVLAKHVERLLGPRLAVADPAEGPR